MKVPTDKEVIKRTFQNPDPFCDQGRMTVRPTNKLDQQNEIEKLKQRVRDLERNQCDYEEYYDDHGH